MKPNYQNWVPKKMVTGFFVGAGAALLLFVLFGATGLILHGTARVICAIVLGLLTLVLLGLAVWMLLLHRSFDYDGKRKLSRTIVEGVAKYVELPEGGVGLDVGCGSGALTIACAKRNPKAQMIGCDIWSGAYKAVFTKELCEQNAKAEGVENARFERGDATKLPFADGVFDAVTSNYVYHNIPLADRQSLLLETLRTLKKGGCFALHDIMSKRRYGDMEAFAEKLRGMGYEEVRLIDTTDGMFLKKKEAAWLDLAGSTLLVGRK